MQKGPVATAGIDWTKIIGIAALVLSAAVIWFVMFELGRFL
jgi:isoprenylcysteine carboxyl methyltransferase (ICMT) family protein YpbQ